MSQQTTTALTAEQVADFHEAREEQQDDLLAASAWSWRNLVRPLPACFRCGAVSSEVVMNLPRDPEGSVNLTFRSCGHAFHADHETLTEGLRLYNLRKQS